MSRYVYKHRGNGLIVDNVLKPLGRKAKEFGQTIAKPFLKKTAKKAARKAGQKAIQMTSERAGDLIRKRLNGTIKGRKTPISNVTQRRIKAQGLRRLMAMS